MQYFFELYQDCFQHHIQSRLQSSGTSLTAIIDESRKRLVQQDELTAYFIRHIYHPAEISHSPNASSIDQKKHQRSFDEMLQDVTGNPIDNEFPATTSKPGTNRVTFLVGDVGVGKSLLTTKIIATVQDRNATGGFDYQVLPIYLDFELLLRNEYNAFKDIDESFVDAILSAIKTLLTKEGMWNARYEDATSESSYQKFVRLNFNLLKDKIRLFLIFDNTDRYHFYYTKYSFFDTYRRKQSAEVRKNFSKIFSIFSRVEYLGDQGLAILFVCRRSVLKFWIASGRPEDNHKSLILDYGVYQIARTDEQTAIGARIALAEAAIDEIEKKHPAKSLSYREHLGKINDALKGSLLNKGPNSLNRIRDLTHHGTRSFVDFLGALKIDFRTQYELVERLFEKQPHNLLRLYITNLKKRFAQFGDHFPNLFLVDAVVAPVEEFLDVHIAHRHTYWLKYLILKYIVVHMHRGDISTYNELREHFVDACGYEPHLFNLVLGSLNAVNSFRCIEVDEDAVGIGDCLRVRPTSRGLALLADHTSEFCFDFDYIQFVIDDPQLSLPVQWARKVYVDADLGYVMSASSVYKSGLAEYLKRKAEAVIYFLHILKASGQHEAQTRLRNAPEIKDLLPDFDMIFENLFNALRTILTTHVPRGEETVITLEQLHRELQAERGFAVFFQNQEEMNCQVEPS